MSDKKDNEDQVAVMLSGASTGEAACQLMENSEGGGIRQGMLLLIRTRKAKLVARVGDIVPYNAFYTEGDPWSEARRKGMVIPDEVARRYEICRLELLTEIPRAEIKYPPEPGDSVFKLRPEEHEKDIFGVARGEKEHVWYGTLSGYKASPVPLNVENIPMHVAVFGVTGSGKSFDTGALIEKLVEIPVGDNSDVKVSYPMIIIDAHGDYTDYTDFVAAKKQVGRVGWIKRYVFPDAYMRPELRKDPQVIQPLGLNLDLISQRELSQIIILSYKGTIEGAELQVSGIDSLFDHMRDQGFNSMHDLFVHNFSDLMAQLETYADISHMHLSTKSAIERALLNFRTVEDTYRLLSQKSELRQEEFVDKITKEQGIAIMDFSADGAPGVKLFVKQLVMTYLATLLFEKFTKFKNSREDRYLMLVIEEAQNFAPDRSYPIGSSLAHFKLSDIATQGRKFGLSLCLISQRPSFVDRIVLSMCNTFFIHRVSPDDVSFVKSVTGGLPDSLANRLTNLDKGELILTGQMNAVPFPLNIVIPSSDRKVPHTIGKTRVVANLAKLRGY